MKNLHAILSVFGVGLRPFSMAGDCVIKTAGFLVIFLMPLFAGTLRIDLSHQFGDQPLTLNSLKYESAETLSVSRLSYLISQPALQNENGSWQELPRQYAFINASTRRTSFTLTKVPPGTYKSFRFSLGVPKKENHGDPAQYPADHPLNPNLNNLHWDWAGGYIFLAFEGQFRSSPKKLNGFVYHLANDQNFSRVQLAANFRIKNNTALALSFDLKKLLNQPRALSFGKDGNSTHSHPGDAISSALVANLKSSFSVRGISYPPGEVPLAAVTPLFLPKKYTPFPLKMSRRFPMPLLPRDNPLLTQRVALGKKLFHDKSLSKDGSISCATCHHQDKAFTDGLKFSKGINDQEGDKNSMPLFNLAWKSSFFWDGRAKSLRDQVLQPIQDHREMASDLKTVVPQLQKNESRAFENAFGPGPVTEEKIALALENFLLTLTSYDSKFDRAMSGKAKLSEAEQRGMELFFTEYEPRSQQYGADCFHCHGGSFFSDHQFHNNGLKPSLSDVGLMNVTGKEPDRGKFSTPSLRNIALTAPYMHDGR
ncbi:cytochrome C peroxidase, partial [Akkermansiaceae bacterium]|nr:cytochrome C peroxidase [Akkermansiaceae bacterium]